MTTFEILGVNPSDSQEVIKKNYRKLTLKYHPDRNQGSVYAEKKFKEITKAYSINEISGICKRYWSNN